MIKIVICDDFETDRTKLRKYITEYCEEKNYDYELYECASGEECLDIWDADIMLLDIEMPTVDGFAIRDTLINNNSGTKIIYVTCHDEVWEDAYGENVVGFITKPIDYKWLAKKMDYALRKIITETKTILIDVADGNSAAIKIPLREVMYIKAGEKCTFIYLQNGTTMVSQKKIGEYYEAYIETFGMPHRSYLVNYQYVSRMDKGVHLSDAKTGIPLSRYKKEEFKKGYNEYKKRSLTEKWN